MPPVLIVHGGREDGTVIPIIKERLDMGSLSGADIYVTGLGVSPRHAEISWSGAGYYLANLNQGFKTSLNHRDIGGVRYLLRNGDRIRLGDSPLSHELVGLETNSQLPTCT